MIGDVMLGISGKPYDTLEEVIGLRSPKKDGTEEEDDGVVRRSLTGNMKEWGIGYEQVGRVPSHQPGDC